MLLAVVVVLSATLLPRGPGRAQELATTQCVFVSPTVFVTMGAEDVVLSVGERQRIFVNGDECPENEGNDDVAEVATTKNTEAVDVSGTDEADRVRIEDAGIGGPFPDRLSFMLNLHEDFGDILDLDLTDENDIVYGDPGAIYLYPDRLGLVEVGGADLVEIDASGGSDVIYAGGPVAAFTNSLAVLDPGPLLQPVTVWGGDGGDFLIGGADEDDLYGEEGADWLDGQGGDHDVLIGGPDAGDQCLYPEGSYAPCDPAIELEPKSGREGSRIIATGTGWYPETGDVGIDFEAVGDPPAFEAAPMPDGSFSEPVTIPAGEASIDVVACQPCSTEPRNESRTTFEYTSVQDVTLTLRPRRAVEGNRVSVSGSGWEPGQKVLIFVDQVTVEEETVAREIPGEDTNLATSFLVEDLEAGRHTVIACQRCGGEGAPRVEQPLRVVIPAWDPSITIEPASASAGEFLVVRGDGWMPNVDVSVLIPGAPRENVTVPAAEVGDGSFETRLEVPDVTPRTYTVVACQSCGSPRRLEDTALVSIVSIPWWESSATKVGAGLLMVLLAAAAYFLWRRIDPRRPRLRGPIRARLSDRAMKVSVSTVDDGSSDHLVRLVPLRDPGVQRIEEEVSLR
jgi:hypothetical protein